MRTGILKELKAKLEKEKGNLEKELKGFAKKDKKLKGDWDTKYPKFNGGMGSQGLEEAADEVEEYLNLLPVEANLELKLQSINSALEKIKKAAKGPASTRGEAGEPRQGQERYGKCEKCKKSISLDRLRAYPEARLCLKCRK